ncbi:hypothetical protein [Sagittula marina]|nr:hypothetical protein [Sagittula marina]
MMRIRDLVWALPVVALTACTQFPELDTVQSEGVAQAPYPDLIPLEGVVGQPTAPNATVEVIEQVEGRVGGLQSRADRLSRRDVAQEDAVARRLRLLRERAEELRQQQL